MRPNSSSCITRAILMIYSTVSRTINNACSRLHFEETIITLRTTIKLSGTIHGSKTMVSREDTRMMNAVNAHDFTYLENVDDTFIGSHGNYSTTQFIITPCAKGFRMNRLMFENNQRI